MDARAAATSTGEYTLVFEHVHEQVGLRAAALALETVQRAFAGTLETVRRRASAELTALAATARRRRRLTQRVLCGITGGDGRGEARARAACAMASPRTS